MQPQVVLVLVALCALLRCCAATRKGRHAHDNEPAHVQPLMLTPTDCLLPREVGMCRAAIPRFYFNNATRSCEQFIYGGCGGNGNNFDSQQLCAITCDAKDTGEKELKKVPELSEDFTAHCAVAPETGPCRAAFYKFYFDTETQSCKTFMYGGCGGNGNRYDSSTDCMERCANGRSSEGRANTRNRWTAAFFLFLTLAAVSFLLLTALIIVTTRRRLPPIRTLSIRSDKEELLNDGERSSLDSLPLPESPNNPSPP